MLVVGCGPLVLASMAYLIVTTYIGLCGYKPILTSHSPDSDLRLELFGENCPLINSTIDGELFVGSVPKYRLFTINLGDFELNEVVEKNLIVPVWKSDKELIIQYHPGLEIKQLEKPANIKVTYLTIKK